MKSLTRPVLIGDGIVGVSTRHHLTQEGWSEVVLAECDELTSGIAWHSAAQVTNFATNQTMAGLESLSIRPCKKLAEDPDNPINDHFGDGGIRLASTEAQMRGHRHFASMASAMDVHFEAIDAEECARRHSLIFIKSLMGGLRGPREGGLDPAQLCLAFARRARGASAEVNRNMPDLGLTRNADDSWSVHAERSDTDCDVVVNACGNRVNDVAIRNA